MKLASLLAVEIIKLRRTWVLAALSICCLVAPAMIALMMAAIQDPELGAKLGLFTAKAELTIGSADWQTYAKFVCFVFVGGIAIIGFAMAAIFGGEYVEGTAKNLFSLPVRRSRILGAKLLLVCGWYLLLAFLIVVEAYAFGLLLDLPGRVDGALAALAGSAATMCLQVLLLSPVPAYLAIRSGGIVAPIGFSVLLLVLAQFFTQSVLGPWFPWSIPLVSAGAAEGLEAGPGSWIVLAAVFIGGFVAAWRRLEKADLVA